MIFAPAAAIKIYLTRKNWKKRAAHRYAKAMKIEKLAVNVTNSTPDLIVILSYPALRSRMGRAALTEIYQARCSIITASVNVMTSMKDPGALIQSLNQWTVVINGGTGLETARVVPISKLVTPLYQRK
jgi:hypothetical protein